MYIEISAYFDFLCSKAVLNWLFIWTKEEDHYPALERNIRSLTLLPAFPLFAILGGMLISFSFFSFNFSPFLFGRQPWKAGEELSLELRKGMDDDSCS